MLFCPTLNLIGLFKAIKGQLTYKGDSFPYSGVHVFTGPQGGGKTYAMLYTLRDILKEYPKVTVLSDMELNGINYVKYSGFEDIDKYSNEYGLVCVLDEIHLLFSSLTSKGSTHQDLQLWSQNRKNKRLILGTSQRFSRIAKPIREQCTSNIEVKAGIIPGTMHYRIIDAECYDDSGKLILDRDNIPKWHFAVRDVSVFDIYDTFYQIKGDICKR